MNDSELKMTSEYSERFALTYVLREADLRSLIQLIEQHVGPVTATIKCSDDITREMSPASELLEFENPRTKEIVEVTLSARAEDFSRSAQIVFNESFFHDVSLRFKGDEYEVSKLKDGTLNVLDGCRPWYERLSQIDYLATGTFVVFLMTLGMVIAVGASKLVRPISTGSRKLPESTNVKGWFIVGTAITFIIALGYGLNLVRESWFPRTVFAIGQGEQRFENLERIHWGFLIALAVSVIASVLVIMVQVLFKRVTKNAPPKTG